VVWPSGQARFSTAAQCNGFPRYREIKQPLMGLAVSSPKAHLRKPYADIKILLYPLDTRHPQSDCALVVGSPGSIGRELRGNPVRQMAIPELPPQL
jgi:hypothetical protein